MPSGDLQTAELELRLAEDSDAVSLLKSAARTLVLTCRNERAAFPPVAVVRLYPRGVELLLSEPAPAVQPFVAVGPQLWRFDATTAGHLLASEHNLDAADIEFPFPLLVTIGDDDRGPVMVNIETAGALTIIGDSALTGPFLNALAIELATSDLSTMAVVHLHGLEDDLPKVAEPQRSTSHPSVQAALAEPRRFHRDTAASLRHAGHQTMHEARIRGDADLTYPSPIAILFKPLTGADIEQIIDSEVATPGAGTGIIATSRTEADALPGWRLRPDALLQLRLEPFGLTVHPQRLDTENLARISDILRISGTQGDVAPTDPRWTPSANLATTPSATADAAELLISGTEERLVDAAAPMIRVLGPVMVSGARGEPPTARITKVTEVAAFLALHPESGRDSLTDAIWPIRRVTANYRQQIMSILRSWLGHAPDNEPYVGLYRLHPSVRCDWTEFAELAKRGLAHGAAGLPDLVSALALVRGRPFSGIRSGTYAWSDALVQNDIIPAISDIAEIVARFKLETGDPQGARAAAATGLLADSSSEALLRFALRAAHARRDQPDIDQLIARLDAINDELDDNEPETLRLLAQIRSAL